MKKFYLFCCFVVAQILSAQTPVIDWVQTGGADYSDGVTAMTRDGNGNIYTAGFYNGTAQFGSVTLPDNSFQSFLVKYDAAGNLLWIKGFQGINQKEIKDIAVDSQGNIALIGDYWMQIDLDPSANEFILDNGGDGFIAKYDTNGNFLWGGSIGGESSDLANSVTFDANGNVYVAGLFRVSADLDIKTTQQIVTGNSDANAYLVSYDPDGNHLWHVAIASETGYLSAQSVAVQNGSVYITGEFSVSADFDPSANVALKTAENEAFYLAKYTSDGSYVWANILEADDAFEGIQSNRLAADPGGNIYVTGWFIEGFDADPSANTTALTGPDFYESGFLLKYDGDGSLLWATTQPGIEAYVNPLFLSADNDGRVAVSGIFGTDISFGSGTDNAQTFTGYSDIFVAIYEPDGMLQSAATMGSTADGFKQMQNDYPGGVFLTTDALYLAGRFTTTTNFAFPGQDAHELTISEYQSEAFLASYQMETLGTKDTQTTAWMAFPNPVQTTLHLSQATEALTLLDVQGRFLNAFPAGISEIDMSGYATGMYLLKSKSATTKILKK